MSDRDPYDLRAKYTHFRILVIGRANAGKTTLFRSFLQKRQDVLKLLLVASLKSRRIVEDKSGVALEREWPVDVMYHPSLYN